MGKTVKGWASVLHAPSWRGNYYRGNSKKNILFVDNQHGNSLHVFTPVWLSQCFPRSNGIKATSMASTATSNVSL
jgi:hypothetical protein